MAAFDCSCSACLFRLSRNGCSRPILRSTSVADIAQVRIGIEFVYQVSKLSLLFITLYIHIQRDF